MLLPSTQFGFRKAFSTKDANTRLANQILHAIDTQKKINWNVQKSEQKIRFRFHKIQIGNIISESKFMIYGLLQDIVSTKSATVHNICYEIV
ncbi:hypothetical protein QTP88_009522 [Uroleucon formosanum]